MAIRLVALDMDGTILLDDHLTVTPAVRQAICAAAQKGVQVVPATGRVFSMLPDVFLQMEEVRYVINSNGASVRDLQEDKVIYQKCISVETAGKILEMLEPYGLLIQFYCEGNIYTEKRLMKHVDELPFSKEFITEIRKTQQEVDSLRTFLQEHPEGIEKCNLAHVPSPLREELWKTFGAMPELAVVSSAGSNLELNRRDASKGDALRHLCEQLHIAPEEVMAVGDSGNDIEMLQFAGYSVAMGNSTPDAMEAAKYRTASNQEDGVALAIQKFILEG